MLIPFTATEVMTVVRSPRPNGHPGAVNYVLFTFTAVVFGNDPLSAVDAAALRSMSNLSFLPTDTLTSLCAEADSMNLPAPVPVAVPVPVPSAITTLTTGSAAPSRPLLHVRKVSTSSLVLPVAPLSPFMKSLDALDRACCTPPPTSSSPLALSGETLDVSSAGPSVKTFAPCPSSPLSQDSIPALLDTGLDQMDDPFASLPFVEDMDVLDAVFSDSGLSSCHSDATLDIEEPIAAF